MSYLALYRKYRPDNFDDVVGQNSVIKVLKNSVIYNKFSHAYLFYGPRGTGKTTIAKAIAKIINCNFKTDFKPCEKCPSCVSFNEKNNPDIMEIDAASNNGVDEIREICDKVNLSPSISKYKIYIIDEVHMLSSGAFNALLKTLEEPPKHIIFILATTEIHKVPETIISRCQTFEFNRISEKDIISRLNVIVKNENIAIEDGVIQLIAKYSDGGLRDAINMLDKLSGLNEKITIKDFYDYKGLVEEDIISNIYNLCLERDLDSAVKILDKLSESGKNITLLAEDLLIYIKNLIINASKNKNANEINELYNRLDIMNETINSIKTTIYKKDFLQIGLVKLSKTGIQDKEPDRNYKESDVDIIKSKDIINEKTNSDNLNQKINTTDFETIMNENKKIRINNALTLADKFLLENMKSKWNDLSGYLYDSDYSGVVSYLVDGKLRVAGQKDVIISLTYESIVNNADMIIEKLEDLYEKVMGSKYKIAFVSDDDWEKIKKDYIKNKKDGVEYNYIEEKEMNKKLDSIEQSSSEIVNNAINLFGKEIVTLK